MIEDGGGPRKARQKHSQSAYLLNDMSLMLGERDGTRRDEGDVTRLGIWRLLLEKQLVYLTCQRWCIATQALPDRAEPVAHLGRRLDEHGEIPNLDYARLASS
jgi:hypothetical protein